MKAFYIHGLDSYPVPGKMDILRKAGFAPASVRINYYDEENVYGLLKEQIIQQNAACIIGSSMGGLMGYWLAEELGLPCLLFNPAMDFSPPRNPQIPQLESFSCPLRYVVMGLFDDSVDPLKSTEFFEKNDHDNVNQRLITCHWLGHQIDFDTFAEMANLFFNGLKIHGLRVN